MPELKQRVSLLTAPWRWLAATLLALAAVNLPFSLVAVLVMRDPPVTPGMLLRSILVFSLLPAAAAWAIVRLLRGSIAVEAGMLRCERPGMAIEIPAAAIQAILPWRVPLPGPGVSLLLTEAVAMPCNLLARSPDALLELLDHIAPEPAKTARQHPTAVFARSRRKPGVLRLLLEFPGFALLPTAILFNLHQHIAYGGALGQYYLYGAKAYLATFAIHWTTVTTYLVLYASVWRGLAEAATLSAAWLAPARTMQVRIAAERAVAIAYYGGAPLILLLRLLS